MFTLAHLSDPHLAPLAAPRRSELIGKRITGYINWLRRRRFLHQRAVLDRLTADLKTQDADHIAVTGDLANIALEGEYAPGRAWLDSLGNPQNVSFVPGNHDAYVRAGLTFIEQAWGPFMRGDDGAVGFPYLRRRGPLALIGLSTAVPTGPGMATGRLGGAQIEALTRLLGEIKADGLFRVILIHHPPVSAARWHKRLVDAAALKGAIAAQGAELLLHGHDHLSMLNWLAGPDGTRVPAVGVPSASATPGIAPDSAGYNLYVIDGETNAWRCQMVSRGITADGMAEQKRTALAG